jgi:hypothetical protein
MLRAPSKKQTSTKNKFIVKFNNGQSYETMMMMMMVMMMMMSSICLKSELKPNANIR